MESIPQPWLTAHYHPGDLLIFHNLMIHWSLPNRSDRIRLSIDTREPGRLRCPSWRRGGFERPRRKIADEEGASEALLEDLMIELMRRGWEPERANIKALMVELSQAEEPSTSVA